MTKDTSIAELPGVGKTRKEKLEKLGIFTVGDLVFYFPRAHEMRGNVLPLSHFSLDCPASYIITVSSSVSTAKIKQGLTISKFRAFDDSGHIEIVFFNSPYVKDVFHIGDRFRIYGKVTASKNKLQIANPKYEPYLEGVALPDYIPIYHSTDSISSKQIEKLVTVALNDVLPDIIDYIPDNLRIENNLPTLSYAIKNAHFPESADALSRSLLRLAFDEIMLFGIGISLSSMRKNEGNGIKFKKTSLEPLTSLLPYELTPSQKAAVNDIYKDTVLGNNALISPMARILVGDVGTGKTICAVMAMYIAVQSGYQAALMVPTEILARQHYSDIKELLGTLGIKTELLLGSTAKKEKTRIYSSLKSGECDIVIGTHALISDNVDFSRLGLVVTDEQHRFGVNQRSLLKSKTENVHMLVMSATPIPRTL
ncbi:MAG: DEAD/DEAH box helicase, partial [Clostridia bacterium]|nr:DEAD/DEAH box helicase [Clostridia bacterium]